MQPKPPTPGKMLPLEFRKRGAKMQNTSYSLGSLNIESCFIAPSTLFPICPQSGYYKTKALECFY